MTPSHSAPVPGADADPALGIFRALSDDGALEGRREPLARALRLALYRDMRRVRRVDERMTLLQRQGRIGFYGSCTGQEAAPVAAGHVLAPTDWVFPALRESAVLLVRGFSLRSYLAQLFGNSLDVLKGRQMPSHHASRRLHQVSWSSCIATQLPQAVGAAYAARRQGRRDVVLAFLGDGATSHPDFHAGLNFAGVFRVPLVFVCQNNQYAISVPSTRQTASKTFAIKARAYGVEAARVDGNDILAVYESLGEALARARSGGGPTLIECVTYRIGAHSSSDDPTRYRTAEEVERWRARDPIVLLRRNLEREGAIDAQQDRTIDSEVDAEIDAALRDVESAPPPQRGTLFDDVYEKPTWNLTEQRELLARTEPPPVDSK
jgi:pyruvate dehydrogenase E1 component alpha subunit/2-oxoisovalerate dehydrogenase E1 component alpha subunit